VVQLQALAGVQYPEEEAVVVDLQEVGDGLEALLEEEESSP